MNITTYRQMRVSVHPYCVLFIVQQNLKVTESPRTNCRAGSLSKLFLTRTLWTFRGPTKGLTNNCVEGVKDSEGSCSACNDLVTKALT